MGSALLIHPPPNNKRSPFYSLKYKFVTAASDWKVIIARLDYHGEYS